MSFDISKLTPIPKLPLVTDKVELVTKTIPTTEHLVTPQTNLPKIILSPLPSFNPELTEINTTNQITTELTLAPLSPKSPRITIKNTPEIKTHPTTVIKTETCPICYDSEVPIHNLLTCGHPVCEECIEQLQTAECPFCKKFLEGPLVTDSILANILNREEQKRMNEITANYLAGVYLEQHPDANLEDVYQRYTQ